MGLDLDIIVYNLIETLGNAGAGAELTLRLPPSLFKETCKSVGHFPKEDELTWEYKPHAPLGPTVQLIKL